MVTRAKIVICGTGEFARAVTTALAHLAPPAGAESPSIDVVVAGHRAAADAACLIAGVQTSLGTQAPGTPAIRFRPAYADLTRPGQIAAVLDAERPDGVLVCASTQSPWEHLRHPSAWTRLLAAAGFGLTLPFQAEIATHAAHAIGVTCPGAWLLNACFPDAVNAVLAARGLPVLAGAGNIALVAACAAHELGVPAGRVRVLAHHVHLAAGSHSSAATATRSNGNTAGGTAEALVWLDDQPVAGVAGLLRGMRAAPRPAVHAITAHTTARLVLDLLAGRTVSAHLPGPGGLPGGYPVRIGPGGAYPSLPPALTIADAVAANQRWAAHDGVVVDGSSITFSERVVAAVAPHVPEFTRQYSVDEVTDLRAILVRARRTLSAKSV